MSSRRTHALVLALCGLLLVPFGATRAELIEEIVAWVNGDIITLSEFEEEQDSMQSEIYRQFSGEELDEAMARMKETLLMQMIDRKILVHHAQALGYDTDKMGTVFLDSFRQQQGIESEEEFNRLLAQEGLTVESVKNKLVEMYAPEEVIRFEVISRVGVGDREITAYYDDNPEQFFIEGDVTFREIVLLADTDKKKRKRREEAEAVLARANAGEDFVTLVEEVSEAGTASNGGLMGPIKREDLSELLAETAFTLPVGIVSPLMETPYGFHIIRVETRTEDGARALDEVREQLRTFLEDRKYRTELNSFLEKARSESEWCVKPKFAELLPVASPPCQAL